MYKVMHMVKRRRIGTDGVRYLLAFWRVARCAGGGFMLEGMYVDNAYHKKGGEIMLERSAAVMRSLVTGRTFVNVVTLPESLLSNYTILLAAKNGVSIPDVGLRMSEDMFYVIEQDGIRPGALEELKAREDAKVLVEYEESSPEIEPMWDDPNLYLAKHADIAYGQPTVREVVARDIAHMGKRAYFGYLMLVGTTLVAAAFLAVGLVSRFMQ